jgi:hypothetical protein
MACRWLHSTPMARKGPGAGGRITMAELAALAWREGIGLAASATITDGSLA